MSGKVMTAIPISSQQMTLEEYLEFDYNAEGRYEYFDYRIAETHSESPERSLLGNRIGFLLQKKLFDKACPIYNSQVLLKIPAVSSYYRADVSALCGNPIYEKSENQILLVNPNLIVEILATSTEDFQRGLKFSEYKSIESLREYILIRQDIKFVTLLSKYDEKFWLHSEYEAGETLKLESLDCELGVDEIYQGIIFES